MVHAAIIAPPVALAGSEMQRPTDSCSTSMRQPRPAMAGAADDGVERHEHILALDRAVLERNVERKVPPADADARRVARNQRAGDADVLGGAEQVLGIEHAEGEADDRRDRRERDVALGEVEPDADDLAAFIACRGTRCRCR